MLCEEILRRILAEKDRTRTRSSYLGHNLSKV